MDTCQMQSALRWDHIDDFARKCYIVGSSNHNQCIESWWSVLTQHHAQFWINIFENLKDRDLFLGDFLDRNLIQFVFMKMIQVSFQLSFLRYDILWIAMYIFMEYSAYKSDSYSSFYTIFCIFHHPLSQAIL